MRALHRDILAFYALLTGGNERKATAEAKGSCDEPKARAPEQRELLIRAAFLQKNTCHYLVT